MDDEMSRRLEEMRKALHVLEERREALSPQRPTPVFQRPLEGVRVVVVDDDQDTRELLDAALSLLGAQVQPVSSALEAMRALDECPPDVIVADISMPTVDGYALMRTIRSREADRGGQVPAIALTAFDGPGVRSRALRVGYTDYLAKPTEPDVLMTTIRQILGS